MQIAIYRNGSHCCAAYFLHRWHTEKGGHDRPLAEKRTFEHLDRFGLERLCMLELHGVSFCPKILISGTLAR